MLYIFIDSVEEVALSFNGGKDSTVSRTFPPNKILDCIWSKGCGDWN